MQVGVRIEESWSMFRPYRWLAERSVGRNRRKLFHRESFRASVLHHSEIQAVLESIAVQRCLLTTPSFLSSGTRPCQSAKGLPPAQQGGVPRLLIAFQRRRRKPPGAHQRQRRGVLLSLTRLRRLGPGEDWEAQQNQNLSRSVHASPTAW